MALQIDPWLSKDLQISKSVFNHNFNSFKSPQITGRKLNNALCTICSHKPKQFQPKIVLTQSPTAKKHVFPRNIAGKRSSGRSLSLNKIDSEKESILEIPIYVSPPRQLKKSDERCKQSNHVLEPERTKKFFLKNSIADTLVKLGGAKQETLKLECSKGFKVECKNKASKEKKHPKVSGLKKNVEEKVVCASNRHKTPLDSKNSGNEENKYRSRDSIVLKKTLRLKYKKKAAEDKSKRKRSPEVLHYLKKQDLADVNTDGITKQPRKKIERPMKGRTKIKRGKKTSKPDHIVYSIDWSASFDGELNQFNRDTVKDHKEIITNKLKILQQRISRTQTMVKTRAAVRIQRWFRSNRRLFNIKNQDLHDSLGSIKNDVKNNEGWPNVNPNPSESTRSKSDLVNEFEERFLERPSDVEKTPTCNERFSSKAPSIIDHDAFEIPSDFDYSENEKISECLNEKVKKVHKVPPLSLGLLIQGKKLSEDLKIHPKLLLQEPTFTGASIDQANSSSSVPSPQHSLNSFESSARSSAFITDSLNSTSFLNKGSDESLPITNLKEILANSKPIESIPIERPVFNLINDSDTSEEQWNSTDIQIYPDSNISEEVLDKNKHADLIYSSNFEADLASLLAQEISLFISGVPFILAGKEIDPSFVFIEKVIQVLLEKLLKNEEEILEMINTPAYQDPVYKLESLQREELSHHLGYSALEMMLAREISAELKLELNDLLIPSRQIYIQMIFDCVNESLNHIRPFGLKGLPDPWSAVSPTLYGEGQLQAVFKKALKIIRGWAEIRAGIYADNDTRCNEEQMQKMREERVSALILQNVLEEESKWSEYDNEETQVKIEVAKGIFELVVNEAVFIINLD